MFINNTRRPSKTKQIEQLRREVASLRARVDLQGKGQEVTISMVEFLLSALEDVIGATATQVSVQGKLKVALVGSVRVSIDAFARKAHLSVNGPRSQSVPPVDLEFDENGKLSPAQMRTLKGFLAEIDSPVVATHFWDGVKAPAA